MATTLQDSPHVSAHSYHDNPHANQHGKYQHLPALVAKSGRNITFSERHSHAPGTGVYVDGTLIGRVATMQDCKEGVLFKLPDGNQLGIQGPASAASLEFTWNGEVVETVFPPFALRANRFVGLFYMLLWVLAGIVAIAQSSHYVSPLAILAWISPCLAAVYLYFTYDQSKTRRGLTAVSILLFFATSIWLIGVVCNRDPFILTIIMLPLLLQVTCNDILNADLRLLWRWAMPNRCRPTYRHTVNVSVNREQCTACGLVWAHGEPYCSHRCANCGGIESVPVTPVTGKS